MIYDNETLKLARQFLGKSQSDLAELIDVSQASISKIEKGITPLSEDVVNKLSAYFQTSFFTKMSNPFLKVHYRASATIGKKFTEPFEARLYTISKNLDHLTEIVELPENKIPAIDPEERGFDIENIAEHVRNFMGLGRSPIQDIVRVLEKHGVLVYFFEYPFISSQNKNFDGVSFFASGVPVILVNNKIQNARKVFTIAHELGHLVMHNQKEFFIDKNRDIEKEANRFASEFIAPLYSVLEELSDLTLEKLFQLKSYWKISAAAILYKAKDNYFTQDQYRRWITKMAPYRKSEPYDFDISHPKLINDMFIVAEEELGGKDELYNELGLTKMSFNDIYSTLNTGNKERVKMYVV
jgi:Zn-dependent peptidase ImmA (M78 family)/DNA-binding XRE family transcriptional regulator